MLLGIYKSFEELEENLTLDELTLMLKAEQAKEERLHKVLAAVNGIKWGDGEGQPESGEDAVERLKKQAAAMKAGKTVEEMELENIGIKFT